MLKNSASEAGSRLEGFAVEVTDKPQSASLSTKS